MEEIRSIALAYYSNLSEKSKTVARELFKIYDSDGDGSVSLKEFLALRNYDTEFCKKVFSCLDKSGDGELDYEEFLTFFYILLSGRGFLQCDGCGGYLSSVYFTCSECFSNYPHCFDLCLPCYRAKNYTHNHAIFLDNYTILRKIQEEGRSSEIIKHSVSKKCIKTVGKCVGAVKTVSEFTDALNNAGDFTDALSNVVDVVDALSNCTIM